MDAAQVLTVTVERAGIALETKLGTALGTGTMTTVEGAEAVTVDSAFEGPTMMTEPVGVGRWTVMVMWFTDVDMRVEVPSSLVAVTVASSVAVEVLEMVVRAVVVSGMGTMVSVMGVAAETEEPSPRVKERTSELVARGAAEVVAGCMIVVLEPTGQLVTSGAQEVMVKTSVVRTVSVNSAELVVATGAAVLVGTAYVTVVLEPTGQLVTSGGQAVIVWTSVV